MGTGGDANDATRLLIGRCETSGGAAQQLATLLAPSPHDFTVRKPRHSAFFATPLELLLQQMKTREIVLVGLAADICVQLTAMDAFLRGFEVVVPRDCTAAESGERKEAALQHMATALRVQVVDSETIEASVGAQRKQRANRHAVLVSVSVSVSASALIGSSR